ncbi:related to choline dehydrogenase [Phialocephala subalpina]|uniref:Related to choline dehydrogenase n=1 Tax=Phialocephala subalpina TaxID=576137 RepID=A0A1L7XGA0_9HELO|nr:related to choline dehydrogenase [Phialocephala subalpina]
MKLYSFSLALAALASAVLASPIKQEERQVNGLIGSLLGTLGANQTFDYIVLGGGTGGLTIAKRLAEDPTVTVAVIEAGSVYQVADPVFASTPGGDVTFVGTKETLPTVDWGFFTSKDPASNSQARAYARGKCLGGSSARNFMIYQRPPVGALQDWADAVDDQSYTFDNFLPYYKKSPQFTPPGPKRTVNATVSYNAGAFSSTGGPLQVSYPNTAQSFSSYMQGALNEIGIPTVQDFNSGSLMGCQYCSVTIKPKDESRDSSQTSFLNEAASAGLTNLKVFTLTMAKKINFDANKKAISVVVESNLISYTLGVNKEVIVSAGAFQSPQLLMVSGVGPAAQVSALGVPLVQDLPGVGQNMQDHIFFGPAYKVDLTTFTKLANDPVYLLAMFAQYTTTQTGPLTNPVADFLGWEKVPDSLRSSLGAQALADLAKLPGDWPEIEYLSGAGYVGDWSSLLFGQPKDGAQYATILAALVAPQSRGNIQVTSADTNTLPIINTAYLQSHTDQQVAIAAYKRVRQAFTSDFMQQTVQGRPEAYPGPSVQTDNQILATIKESLQTVWHASCTCKMGVASDPMAVVDSHARVFGVQGVRVVDASAFPFLPPGHPQSTIYALAEKITDDIKNGQQ